MRWREIFAEFKRRNTRGLAVAYVSVGLLVIVTMAMLLAIFEATTGGLAFLGRTLVSGKGAAFVRRPHAAGASASNPVL